MRNEPTAAALNDFVSAGAYPRKLLNAIHNVRRQTLLHGERYIIAPHHIQFSPTNRCNAKCPWCSCRNVDRTQVMPLDEIQRMALHFANLGTAAVTITGGGEPTLHPRFPEILEACSQRGIQIGLVTNGLLWTAPEGPGAHQEHAAAVANRMLTWLRLSIVDVVSGAYEVERVARMARLLPNVDIGVSFTVTRNVSVSAALAVARVSTKFANITHIRYVEEILNGASMAMDVVEEECHALTTKGIYQRRELFTPGFARCLMSKLKPMIDPQGIVYPCCGVQYADGGAQQSLDMGTPYRMCHWRDYSLETAPFDGMRCVKCYYAPYQHLLEQLEGPPPRHAAFV
jgi:MoaA/NifB/PqqE/SkfB family radical SAM enzyme